MSIRQEKYGSLIQQELSQMFNEIAREHFKGGMISVTKVSVTPDLSLARVYVSVFGADSAVVFQTLEQGKSTIRGKLGNTIGKQVRKVPDLQFHLDDSNDYYDNIDRLLKS